MELPQAGSLSVGELHVDYHKIHKKEMLDIRKHTAMVFQNYNLFAHKTALENISEGLIVVKKASKKEATETARKYLSKVGLSEKETHYPAQLSGGQQQRVAIARALAMNPSVILFDEPTSALDPELVAEVLFVMKKVAREGMTMIVVTHELSFAREVATDVVFMDGGKIIERAPSKEFFKNPQEVRTRQFLQQITPEYAYNI